MQGVLAVYLKVFAPNQETVNRSKTDGDVEATDLPKVTEPRIPSLATSPALRDACRRSPLGAKEVALLFYQRLSRRLAASINALRFIAVPAILCITILVVLQAAPWEGALGLKPSPVAPEQQPWLASQTNNISSSKLAFLALPTDRGNRRSGKELFSGNEGDGSSSFNGEQSQTYLEPISQFANQDNAAATMESPLRGNEVGCPRAEYRVELAMAADALTIPAIGFLVASGLKHSSDRRCLRFHVIFPLTQFETLTEALRATLDVHGFHPKEVVPNKRSPWESSQSDSSRDLAPRSWELTGGGILRTVAFDTSHLESSMKVVTAAQSTSAVCNGLEGCDASRAKRLRKATNFIRFFLAEALPTLTKVIWMDCDVLIRRDLVDLWRRALPDAGSDGAKDLLAAFLERVPMGRFYFDQDIVRNLWRIRYAGDLQVEANSFNDGVIVIDLAQWRKRDVGSDVRWWMQKHREADPALWKFGTQPIFLLLGFGRWQQLPEELYLGDLGFRNAAEFGTERIVDAHPAPHHFGAKRPRPLHKGPGVHKQNYFCGGPGRSPGPSRRGGGRAAFGTKRMQQASLLHFDGEHKPWLPSHVSAEARRSGALQTGWNGAVVAPFAPLSAPHDWLGFGLPILSVWLVSV